MKVTVIFCLVLICSLSQINTAVAETIDCASGDVQCLIAAILQANGDPRKTTIRLAGGTYQLTSIDNETAEDGANGLPSIVSPVTIKAASVNGATIEGVAETLAFRFRLLHVGPTGQLTLDGITLTRGIATSIPSTYGGALLNAGGIVTIVNSWLYATGVLQSSTGKER